MNTHMNKRIQAREADILRSMVYGVSYAASNIAALVPDVPSAATLRRDLDSLERAGLVSQYGEKRGTVYSKTVLGSIVTPLDAHAYFAQSERLRRGLTAYQRDLFTDIPRALFTDDEVTILDTATQHFRQKSARGTDVAAKELERFVIELSWKSSQIEGNTYTLLDTERLLRDGVPASGRSKEEAQMILNHKSAFAYIRAHPAHTLTQSYVEDVHRLLVEHLDIGHGLRKGEVGIVGTTYKPIGNEHQLREELEALCVAVNKCTDPYSKALLAVAGSSYLQPFADGNKRTARLVANALLLGAQCAPLSYRTVEQVEYKECMLAFYEQLTLHPMKRIVYEQYLFACEQYLVV